MGKNRLQFVKQIAAVAGIGHREQHSITLNVTQRNSTQLNATVQHK